MKLNIFFYYLVYTVKYTWQFFINSSKFAQLDKIAALILFRFKEEEKEKRLAQKKAKQDAIRQKQEEEERVCL